MSVSYWQTTGWTPGWPTHEVDVLIIGGGLAGWSTAWWLKDSGLKVAVVDRGDLCAGASGRNAGFVTCGSVEHYNRQVDKHGAEEALKLWRIGQENIDLLEAHILSDGGAEACEYARRGSYSLAGTDHEMSELGKAAELMQQAGLGVEIIDAAEASKRLGARGFAGGVLYPDDGEVHPVKLAQQIRARSGADFYPHHEVHRIEHKADDEVIVHTSRATFRAMSVVLATNGYSHLLDPWFADKIYPTRGQILVTAPVAPFMAAPCYCNFVLDYFRQLPDGRVLIGGFRQLDKEREVGTADEPNPVIHEALEAFLNRHFASLEGVPIEYRWAGVMGFAADGVPMVGSLPGRPNMYFVGGFTAHGVGLAFRTAKVLTDLMLEGVDPGPLSARRFAGRL